jgi:hypothetical protein
MSQSDDEIAMFREFVECAHLPVVLKSIEKRAPPEPDILCKLTEGMMCAFELVEICQPQNAAFFGRVRELAEMIEKTYTNLPLGMRTDFDHKFKGKPLSFGFHPEATKKQIRAALPDIFAELVAHRNENQEYRPTSESLRHIIASIRFVGRVKDSGRPAFNLAGTFQADDMVLSTIKVKLKKTYITPHPIELLSYFGGFAWSKSSNWENSLMQLLEVQGLGPFNRIWVMEPRCIRFAYPQY